MARLVRDHARKQEVAQTHVDHPIQEFAPRTPSISLVLPAWNEAQSLPDAIEEADRALRFVTAVYEIIVVDDGSHDQTGHCLEKLKESYPALRVARHPTNQGYGAALRTGFGMARCDLVVFTDADRQFHLEELDRFTLLAEHYDIVCGYRINRQDSPLRCFYSRIYNMIVRMLMGSTVRDIDCAFKMFHRVKLQQLSISTDGFLVNSELLVAAQQKGFSIVEVGVTHRPRMVGQSTVSIAHIPVVLVSLIHFWWNRVLFPGKPGCPQGDNPISIRDVTRNRGRLLQASILLIAALLLLVGSSYPLIDRDETRYAEIPREMIVSGNWLVPTLNYETYYDKPPLLYWTCALSYVIFGISESAARLVPALSGLGTLAATMAFGNRLFNRRVGALSGVVLLTSAGFLGGSRMLLIDGLLTTCVSCSLFFACESVRCGRLRIGWWLAASVAVGLGFLAKGPVAIVLFLPPLVGYAWLTEGAYFPRPIHWLSFALVVGAIAAPWFVAVTSYVPDFAYEFFYRHNVERFGGAFHARPCWFFLPILLVAGQPWSYLALPCLRYLTDRSYAVAQRRTPSLGFVVLWPAWCLLFFSLSRCKLPPYILPAAPALALLVGKYLDDLLWHRLEIMGMTYARRWAPWFATATAILVGLGCVGYGWWSGFETTRVLALVVASCALLGFILMCLRRQLVRPKLAWGVCALTTLLVAVVVLHREIPGYAKAHTVFGPASPLRTDSMAKLPLMTVGHEWSEVPFYLNRNDITHVESLENASSRFGEMDAHTLLLVARRPKAGRNVSPLLPSGLRVIASADRGHAMLLVIEKEGQSDVVTRSADRDAATR